MKFRKTLTNLVCSALATMALQGTADASPKAEFYPSFGLRNTDFKKGPYRWHEGRLHSTVHAMLDASGDDLAIRGEGDMVAQEVRFGEALALRTEKMTVLAGKVYNESNGKQVQVLGGIDGRSTSMKTGIVDYGWGDNSYFFANLEGALTSYVIGPALSARWINTTDVSENTYQLTCTFGSGRTEEKIIWFPKTTIYKKSIRFNEASVGGRANLKYLVEREPGRNQPKFFAWMEFILGLKLIGQSGGYRNVAFEAEACQFYPLAKSFDIVGAGSFGATLHGIKPEDITGNGNRVYDWTGVLGFRLRR